MKVWLSILLAAASVWAADVLMQHNDHARTGAMLDETALNTSTVNSAKFGKLWTLYADGQVVAQPLYISKLAVDAGGVQGTFNAVVVATMHNTVYVYDADKENPGPEGRTKPLWATWLGPPRPKSKAIDMWSTNDPEWGIVSTPVISPDKKTLYVVAWHEDEPAGLSYRLHALDLKNGMHRLPPVTIGVSSKDPSQPCKPQNQFNPCLQKQRTALLLHDGLLYIAFGGDGNRGALYAFDAQTLTQRAVWSPTPNGNDGGIWQSGQGPAVDAQGNIYLMIGNGTFDASSAGQNYGNSFVKLKLEGQKIVVKDYFTPCNFKFLNDLDLDVGSAGPLLLPGNPARLLSGGKEGVLYLVSQTNMGKHVPGASTAPDCVNANAVQQVRAFPAQVHNGQTHYGNIHGSPVVWKGPDATRVYAWGENSPLKSYKFSQGKLQDVNNPGQSAFRPPPGMPGGMLALSANGNKAGSGIVWGVVPLDGDANQQRGVKGIVLALDAQDISRTLWTSEQFAQRDRLGLFAKFTNPMVAGGKLFVATYGDEEPLRRYGNNPAIHPTQFPKNYYVAVYGLLTGGPAPAEIVNQDRDDVTVVRAVTSPLNLNTSSCIPIDGGSADCTAALAAAAGAPAFHRVLIAPNTNVSGCSLLRVTTAGKTAGIANATGIGFYSAPVAGGNQAAEDSGLFTAQAQLKVSGTATFQNGAAATLHEFVGVVNCPVAGSDPTGRLFKPYMQFQAADGKIFRNWDLAPNYRITHTFTQLNRAADVLK